jgi:hypothetical protein
VSERYGRKGILDPKIVRLRMQAEEVSQRWRDEYGIEAADAPVWAGQQRTVDRALLNRSNSKRALKWRG